jgi:hypothetical protein
MRRQLSRAAMLFAAATFLSTVSGVAQAQDTMGALNGMMGNSEPDGTSLGIGISENGVSVDSSSNGGGWKGGELDVSAEANRDGVAVDGVGTVAQGYAANLESGARANRDGIKVGADGMVDGERIADGMREQGLDTEKLGVDGIEVGDIKIEALGIEVGTGSGKAATAVANMSAGEARQLSKRCGDVMADASAYDGDLVALCRALNSR